MEARLWGIVCPADKVSFRKLLVDKNSIKIFFESYENYNLGLLYNVCHWKDCRFGVVF